MAGARDIAIGFGLTSAVLVIGLALWPHSGVTGSTSEPVCQFDSRNVQHCTIKAVQASITVTAYLEGKWPGSADLPSWQAKTDAGGHFHIDLPPGAYWLTASADAFYYTTTFPVFAGQTAQVQILLVRSVGLAQCLAANDVIATPTGSVPVTSMRPGMIVWTLDAYGRRIASPVLQVSHTPAPAGHHVLRLSLEDGRVVSASPRHPMVDGRELAELRPGDMLDGSRLVSVEEVAYVGDTWDILPAGPTGTYWANGVLLGSTLTGHSMNP